MGKGMFDFFFFVLFSLKINGFISIFIRFVYKFVCDLKQLIGYNAEELARLVNEAPIDYQLTQFLNQD